MMKLIIFDLDGVLVNTKDMHFQTLNKGLSAIDEKYAIPYEEHISTYDGLPTKKKLALLTERKGLPVEAHQSVYDIKQKETQAYLERNIGPSTELTRIFTTLRFVGFKVAVASNAIRKTTETCLRQLGITDLVDFVIANDDVKNPKPNTEMYLTTMLKFNVNPVDTLILEDSVVGREAVHNSGARLCPINCPEDVTIQRIMSYVDGQTPIKWQDKSLNILIPMAGAGSRFEKAGYVFPKPLIEVDGKPMIQKVVENLAIDANYFFVVQKSHYEKYNLKQVLNLIAPGCRIVQVDGITEGAACTTLLAEEYINNDQPLLLANSDQFVDWISSEFMYAMTPSYVDAGILTFEAIHPKWSFAKIDSGFVTEVAEKNPISTHATVGIYYWKRGSDYVKSVKQMMSKNLRVNNEFYVCPAFNEAIQNGLKVKAYQLEAGTMWGLGTPEDLTYFLEHHNE